MREVGQRKNSQPEQKRQVKGSPSAKAGGGIFRIPRGKGFIILLVMVILASYYQTAISDFFTQKKPEKTAVAPEKNVSLPDREAAEFTRSIMATLDETWQRLFHLRGLTYQPPKWVTYSHVTQSACGESKNAIGTFYCPQDSTVYISLSQYEEMQQALGARGDFTQGYVIAHAVGHHVQQLLGLGISEQQANVSTEQELQADCFAGLWGHRMAEQQILSASDIPSAINVGRVTNEERHQLPPGVVMPEQFTYSEPEQRLQRFNQGFVSGELEQCLDLDLASIKP